MRCRAITQRYYEERREERVAKASAYRPPPPPSAGERARRMLMVRESHTPRRLAAFIIGHYAYAIVWLLRRH